MADCPKSRISLGKIWFPLAVVLVAAVQSFGMGSPLRNAPESRIAPLPDTVIYDNSGIFTKFRGKRDNAAEDSTLFLSDSIEGPALTARDTIHAPDSLKYTDPFRYRYYVALVDSLTHAQVRDSLRAAGDSLDWPRLDSIYFADSALRAKLAFETWYRGLSKEERKKYDFEQKMKLQRHKSDSIMAAKDSLKAIRDSIFEAKPRILETYAVSDSRKYSRIFTWTREPYFNNINVTDIDTSYNYWFRDDKFYRKDVNVSYLGTSGSAVQPFDAFRRGSREGISFYTPYEIYTFDPSNLPMYNTKTPYTELAYWGTLFANEESAENNLHLMTTQNIFPSLNFTLGYDREGSNGLLENEKTDNRTFYAAANYMGKRYLAHGGYIYNKVSRGENGGIVDNFWIRDTTVGSREIDVRLGNADNLLKKNTLFLDQTYRIPFTFLRKLMHSRDSVQATGDSLAVQEEDTDITTAFIGHNSEYSVYRKIYTDEIAAGDEVGRNYYNNTFLLNPTQSHDSLRVMKLENKVFMRLQPWSDSAVVSSVNVGIGNRILNHYMFSPDGYLRKTSNTVWNSTYLYGGAAGMLSHGGIWWNATGYYTFAGKEHNDFGLNANAGLQFYPFRKARKSPVSFTVRFSETLDEPDFYAQHYFSNHFAWENNFDKISTTELGATLDIPYWGMRLSGSYGLFDNHIYYDTLSIVRQATDPIHVAKLELEKNFRVWKLHFDNRGLLQYSSDKDIIPVPLAAVDLKWYLGFSIVKNVLDMQIGADTRWTTEWYAPGYNPAVGQFHNQKHEKYGGGSPYIDAFVNMQWKRACIFVKVINVNMGWPASSSDYFAADGYIRPQRAIKFGFYWPFYTTAEIKKAASASGGSSSSGGSRSSDTGSMLGGGRGGNLGGRQTNRLF